VVFHDEDPFVAAHRLRRSAPLAVPGMHLARRREVDLERRPAARLAVDIDVSSALLDDPEDGSQPEAGPFAGLLRGEERFEEPGLSLDIHSKAGIAYGDHHVRSL